MDVIRAIEDYSYYHSITGGSREEWEAWRVAAMKEWELDPDKVESEVRTMVGRDMELKVILDELADWRRRHGVRHITVSVESNGLGQAHGWNGTEKIYAAGKYEPYTELQKNETPGAATPRESK